MVLSKSRKAKLTVWAGLLLFSAVTSGWMLSSEPLEDHECYVGITAREMLANNDWVVPYCNGRLRLEKTPLNYWMVMIASKVTGTVDEFTVRLPNAFFAVLSVAAVMYFTSRLLRFRIAAISAMVWASTLAYITFGHNGRPEMSLAGCVTISLLSFYTAMNESKRKRRVIYLLIFWISLGTGMLAKGPAPLPLVGLPIILYIIIKKEWKFIPKALPVIGSIIFFLIMLPWPFLLDSRLPESSGFLSLWYDQFIGRYTGSLGRGGKPFYYYFYVMFQMVSPWVFFLPLGLLAPFYRIWGPKRKTMLFLWLWFLGQLIFLSFSDGKRYHYLLPAMPAACILIGIVIQDLVFTRYAYSRVFARNTLIGHSVILITGIISAVIITALKKPDLLLPVSIASIIGLFTLLLTATLFAKKNNISACLFLFGGLCMIYMYLTTTIIIPLNNRNPGRTFSRQLAESIPADAEVYAYYDIPMRIIFYFGRPIEPIRTVTECSEKYENGSWILVYGNYIEQFENDESFNLRRAGKWEKAIYSHRDPADAVIYHKELSVQNN